MITDRKWAVDDGIFNTTTGIKTSSTFDGLADYYVATIVSYSDYDPFGTMQDGRKSAATDYRYGFNGMRKDNELKGNSNSYDFGARLYDPRVGRFLSLDAFASKSPFQSPFIFAGNTPLMGIDVNGDSLYILYYTRGHGKAYEDKMFRLAALTRKHDIEKSPGFDPNTDKVVLISVKDVGKVKYQTKWAIDKYSGQYGKTKEVGFFTHSGTNGPVGTRQPRRDNLAHETEDYLKDNY